MFFLQPAPAGARDFWLLIHERHIFFSAARLYYIFEPDARSDKDNKDICRCIQVDVLEEQRRELAVVTSNDYKLLLIYNKLGNTQKFNFRIKFSLYLSIIKKKCHKSFLKIRFLL